MYKNFHYLLKINQAIDRSYKQLLSTGMQPSEAMNLLKDAEMNAQRALQYVLISERRREDTGKYPLKIPLFEEFKKDMSNG